MACVLYRVQICIAMILSWQDDVFALQKIKVSLLVGRGSTVLVDSSVCF